MRVPCHVLPAVLLAALPAAAGAADPRTVGLAVTDAAGAFVPDLRKEEVQVLENGEVRELVGFEKDARPLSVVLVLDTSTGAGLVFRVEAPRAIPAFLGRLPAGSRTVLWATGDRPRKIGELSGSPAEIEKRVSQGFNIEGRNALLDTLVEAAEWLGRESGRRRALVAVSGTAEGLTNLAPGDVTGAVRKAGARVMAAMYREGEMGGVGSLMGLGTMRDTANLTIVGAGDHERILTGLAQGTGGRFESRGTAQGMTSVLEGLGADIAGQYRLRYASSEAKGPKRVEVRLARTGVRWRVAVDTP